MVEINYFKSEERMEALIFFKQVIGYKKVTQGWMNMEIVWVILFFILNYFMNLKWFPIKRKAAMKTYYIKK